MTRSNWTSAWRKLPHPLRWIAVASVGASLVVVGVVFLVLPGPGIPLIVVGLAVLATEFAWAEATLRHLRKHGGKAADVAKDMARRTLRRKPLAPPDSPQG
jgi:uncharacterized protein (TIGR02611 family)